ncbi:MAG: retropepsin-like domain-containing protein [Nanoarchaeota archaeon]|nr:retropepsin-like domain-containing protein [Nanoarchaeota archaeon]MBU1321148.1 retropepsin-like domain-containing protein [Nanoarchaeota archaeon]MBU1597902.1 retropepsin-like domain-containing protein [Nanoarchaeota archaeon]MBU2441617.1 retropepsin-like domain-containing protein [Nanoarchaeota archaeon]
MTISFRYKSVERPDKTLVKTPSIPILLKGKEVFETIGLMDSGADISAMSKDVAELLGLDLRGKKEPAFGIGGKVDSVETKVRITIEKGHEQYTFLIPVKVILGQYDFPVLLGRAGFFEKFIICFDEEKEKISLKRNTNK